MVEVKAQVVGGPVLLAGDIIQVTITLTAPALDPASSAQSSEVNEVVAWGSAQVHCICTVNESRICLRASDLASAEEHAVTNAATSFAPWRGERGHLVLATKPKILFCDLQLLPGQSQSFIYREKLPLDAPPSHRGQLVKYAYKVTVGTQKLGSSISLLRLPIRVIVLPGLSDACIYSESEELAPSNPFLHTFQHEAPRHTALQIIQNVSARKNVSQYNITNVRGHVVKFTIYKTSFRLGEDILATFDFTSSEVPCVQYSVTLQSEEEVSEAYRLPTCKKSSLTSYSKTHEICLSFSHTHLLLPVPLYLTPTFCTDLVTLKWRLHFEFVLNVEEPNTSDDTRTKTEASAKSTNKNSAEEGTQWNAPSTLDIETLVWDLPITIYPSSPNQLAQALGLKDHHTHTLSSSTN